MPLLIAGEQVKPVHAIVKANKYMPRVTMNNAVHFEQRRETPIHGHLQGSTEDFIARHGTTTQQ